MNRTDAIDGCKEFFTEIFSQELDNEAVQAFLSRFDSTEEVE